MYGGAQRRGRQAAVSGRKEGSGRRSVIRRRQAWRLKASCMPAAYSANAGGIPGAGNRTGVRGKVGGGTAALLRTVASAPDKVSANAAHRVHAITVNLK